MDGASVKDRFRVNEDKVNSFITGEYTSEQIVQELRSKGTEENIIKDTHFIASGVQKSFREKQLEPVLRVFYNRTAFQLPDSQRVRISLDTDLTFIREDHLDGIQRRNNNNWRRTDVGIDAPFSYLQEHEILRFPYAVLETKLQTHLGQEPPSWLTNLVESHLVHEVPRFSKYLHGACHFFKEQLPLLPWWLSEMNTDIRKARSENIGLSRSRSFKPLIDGRYRRAMVEKEEKANQEAVINNTRRRSSELDEKAAAALRPRTKDEFIELQQQPLLSHHDEEFSPPPRFYSTPGENTSLNRLIPGNDIVYKKQLGTAVDEEAFGESEKKGAAKSKVKVKVEPKTFFANERTFISWLQFCALLLTVALNLLNFGDNVSRIVGGVFIGLSAGIAIYALYRFEKRAW